MMIAFGDVFLICSETDFTMPAFVLSRSSRDMPGLRAMPAVMITMSESGRLIVAVRADDARVEAFDRRRLPLVEALALRNAFDDVDHDDGARQFLLGDTLRGRRADVAGADDRDLVDHECDSLGG